MGSTDGLDLGSPQSVYSGSGFSSKPASSSKFAQIRGGMELCAVSLSISNYSVVSPPPPQIFEEDTFISRDRSGPTADGSPRAPNPQFKRQRPGRPLTIAPWYILPD